MVKARNCCRLQTLAMMAETVASIAVVRCDCERVQRRAQSKIRLQSEQRRRILLEANSSKAGHRDAAGATIREPPHSWICFGKPPTMLTLILNKQRELG